jgi:hypothetical protein
VVPQVPAAVQPLHYKRFCSIIGHGHSPLLELEDTACYRGLLLAQTRKIQKLKKKSAKVKKGIQKNATKIIQKLCLPKKCVS